ncbi:MAG: type II and III secretion system protein family protein [Pseudomonadota bacterium]
MSRSLSSVLAIVLLAGLLPLFLAPPASAWKVLEAEVGAPVLALEKGRSTVVQASAPFSLIVVADPFIADTKVTTDQSFFVRGKEPGETTILLYGEDGRLVEIIDMRVDIPLDGLRRDLMRLLPGEDIGVYPVHDGVFLDGRVTTAAAADMALKVAERHVPNGVANGLTIEESQQVLLEVRFVEAGRDVVREIGFGFNYAGSDGSLMVSPGLVSGLAEKALGTLTGIGGDGLDISLQALESRGVLRTLAKPNLVALSGDTASFLAGGEIPIPISGADGQISIEYRAFGVSLDFIPTVLGDGLINLRVRPEVSNLDNRNGVRSAGVSVPALSVRRADTSVELRDGEAFAIAGLLQTDFSGDAVNTPWLSKVPVLGALFSSKRYQKNETELMIIITPRLVQPAPTVDALAEPGDQIIPPAEAEFFLLDQYEKGESVR